MPTKLIALAALAVALVATSALPAQANVKRTATEKITAYNTCIKNGGSEAVCCIAAGGDYDAGGYPAPGHPNVIIGESCTITADLSPGAGGHGGKTIHITRPGVVSLSLAQ